MSTQESTRWNHRADESRLLGRGRSHARDLVRSGDVHGKRERQVWGQRLTRAQHDACLAPGRRALPFGVV